MDNKIKDNVLGKLIIVIWIILFMLSACGLIVEASPTQEIEPQPNQYLELKAKTIENVNGRKTSDNGTLGTQSGCWTEIQISNGFDVRFEYDNTKLQPSNISTNEIVNDVTAINDYFKFKTDDPLNETEFDGVLEITGDESINNVIRAAIAFAGNPKDMPASTHIVDKNGSKVISTGEKVKFGEMSFRMIKDDAPFDITGFKLKEDSKSPTTGIKINLDTIRCYVKSDPETGVFRFTDEIVYKDADLTNLVVSSGEVNEEDPSESTYKEYTLDPVFNTKTNNYTLTLLEYLDTINITATQNDAKSTMKIKVPKRDSDGNLVYDSDGTTIIYEEKDISDTVPSEVTLNKLGEPDTEITIKVTAEDGVTENTYKVVIKRPYGIIKGSIYTKPTAALGIYKSNIRLYNSNEVAKEIDWDTIQTGVTDNIHNTLLTIKSQDYITKDDGTYEIYVIPGTYDILIDKAGYLDHIYASKTITEGVTVDLGNKDLIAGDLNKDGVIEVSDLSKFLGGFGTTADDETFQSELDFNEGGSVEISDLSTFLGNYQEVREIK